MILHCSISGTEVKSYSVAIDPTVGQGLFSVHKIHTWVEGQHQGYIPHRAHSWQISGDKVEFIGDTSPTFFLCREAYSSNMNICLQIKAGNCFTPFYETKASLQQQIILNARSEYVFFVPCLWKYEFKKHLHIL